MVKEGGGGKRQERRQRLAKKTNPVQVSDSLLSASGEISQQLNDQV